MKEKMLLNHRIYYWNGVQSISITEKADYMETRFVLYPTLLWEWIKKAHKKFRQATNTGRIGERELQIWNETRDNWEQTIKIEEVLREIRK